MEAWLGLLLGCVGCGGVCWFGLEFSGQVVNFKNQSLIGFCQTQRKLLELYKKKIVSVFSFLH